MAHLLRFIAPTLLASLVATLAAVAAPAGTPAASTAPDCLAKPNGSAAKGNHWYYRVERPSGRHCWYQHAIDAARAAKNAPAQPRAAVEKAAPPRAAAPAPALPPISEASAAPTAPTADNDENIVPPVAAPPTAAPVNTPIGWPSAAVAAAAAAPPAVPTAAPAAAPAAVPGDRAPVRSVEPPPPAPEPKVEALQPRLDAAPAKHLPAQTTGVVRNGEFAEPTTHMPALLGAVSALAIIIIGSFAGRLLANRPRRRPQPNLRPRDWHASVAGMEDESPGIVPVMPGGGDIAHDTSAPLAEAPASPDDWGVRRSRAPRRATPPVARAEAPPSRETTRLLEENVRQLLHRLQGDLRGQPAEPRRPEPKESAASPTRPASAEPRTHVPTDRELDAVLAIWRAKRSG